MKRPLDDEAEVQSLFVSNYRLEDDDDEPISFTVLPIPWSDSEILDYPNIKGKIFLYGSTDNGLQKILMQVIAWRFDLSGVKPEISLLSKDRRWIRLQKPRKNFQDTVRTVLIALYFLHYVKKNPRISAKCIWNNLCTDKDLSFYGFKPSRKDLSGHLPLIGEAAKRDVVLAQSKFMKWISYKIELAKQYKMETNLIPMNPYGPYYAEPFDQEAKDLPQPAIIIGHNHIIDKDTNAEDDLCDSVCAFCDNGGILLRCDGACMRSFHATKEDGWESICDSLGFTQKEANEILSFYCKNCEYHQHQCFACGKLGSSDKVKGAEEWSHVIKPPQACPLDKFRGEYLVYCRPSELE